MVFRLFRSKDKTEAALARTRRGWGLLAIFRRDPAVDDALWEEVVEALVAADVGMTTTMELVGRVRERVQEEKAADAEGVVALFKEEMAALLEPEDRAVGEWYGQEPLKVKPMVLLVVGVNGAGKTTSIAKLAHHYRQMEKHVIIAAADTFRAAAVEQLQVWGERLQVDVVAHRQGADSGAVAYDAYQAAAARGADVLIVDTAGRLHTQSPLMDELQKVRRVLARQDSSAPHQTILVLDATTGQNGLAQARTFRDIVGVDGVFLAKLDGTAKGGIVVAIARELRLPVLFIGTGEGLDDISLFDKDYFVDALFGDGNGGGRTAPPPE